jgi:hypothetical protein
LSIEEFTIALFVRVDDAMQDIPRHPRALLAPSEIVTLALLFVFKGVSLRRFHLWANANLGGLFPALPERSRLLRLFATHRDWADVFLADITPEAICDSLGIELVHPRREGRSDEQIGTKGLSNKRWIVGVKVAPILNEHGLVGDWQCRPANEHDQHFRGMIAQHEGSRVKTDTAFHGKVGDPPNLLVCGRGERGERMVIETVFSQWVGILGIKHLRARTEAGIEAVLAFAIALFNLLASWDGVPKTEPGKVMPSIRIAQFVI